MRYPNEVTQCPQCTRLYDPTIARFMSADSIIPFQYDTQAFNRYSYVKNNPLKYTDPSGHSWFSGVTKWVKKNGRKIAGTVLIVVGAVALYFPPIGTYVGVALMTTGASLIKYNPDEPASPTNEIRVDVGININFDFNRDFQNQYTQDNEQGKYIVNHVSQGTHSTTTSNKFSNDGNRIYHQKWEENDDKQISLKVQGGEQYFVNYKIDKPMPDKYNLTYNLTLGIGG